MTRIILRYLNAPVLVLLVMFGVAIQTSLFNSYPLLYLQPDVVLIAVVWCALHRSFPEGGILTLIFANVAEVHSSAPAGLFYVSYMALYLGLRMTTRFLVVPHLPGLILLTLGASIAWKCIYMTTLAMLGVASNQWRHFLVLLFPGAVMEGVAGIWIYRWLERFDWITYKSERRRKLLEDEMAIEGEGI